MNTRLKTLKFTNGRMRYAPTVNRLSRFYFGALFCTVFDVITYTFLVTTNVAKCVFLQFAT